MVEAYTFSLAQLLRHPAFLVMKGVSYQTVIFKKQKAKVIDSQMIANLKS
jgi:hypothetical protein